MLTTTMSTKGQLIIPSTIRQAHDWHSGIKFSIEDIGNQLILKPLAQKGTLEVHDVAGCIPYKGKKVSIADMEQAPYILFGKKRKKA